jgi:hypothetical protein
VLPVVGSFFFPLKKVQNNHTQKSSNPTTQSCILKGGGVLFIYSVYIFVFLYVCIYIYMCIYIYIYIYI